MRVLEELNLSENPKVLIYKEDKDCQAYEYNFHNCRLTKLLVNFKILKVEMRGFFTIIVKNKKLETIW